MWNETPDLSHLRIFGCLAYAKVIDEEIFLELPPGFAPPGEKMVVKLLNSLYGLKQASRQWNKSFTLF